MYRMLVTWIAAILTSVYSGGLVGVRACVNTIDSSHATLNVRVGGRPFITDGSVVIRNDGTVWIDPDTDARLTSRGVYIKQVVLQDNCIQVHTRVPILGERVVTLTEG